MKNAVVLFYLVLFSYNLFPQISTSEFPKVGYADLYWLAENNTYGVTVDYSSNFYYYPELHDLGLTHVVSFTNSTTMAPAANNSIKIIDNNFPRASNETYNYPFRYAMAAGNTYDYEAGGGSISILTSSSNANNFGFGSNSTSSWWIYPYNSECIGNTNYLDEDYNVRVHAAQVGIHSAGIMLKAKPDATHVPYNSKWNHTFLYKLKITARMGGGTYTGNIAKVRIWEEMPSTSSPVVYEPVTNHIQKTESAATLTNKEYYITTDQLSASGYTDLISTSFSKYYGVNSKSGVSDLYITIEWLGNRDLYVDKIAVYSTYYEDLFLSSDATQTSTRNTIKSHLGSLFPADIRTSSVFTHPYHDEPFPVFYRANEVVSDLSEEELGTGKYINGAAPALANDEILLANSQRRLPYVLYDLYPIRQNITTSSSGTNNIQTAFSGMINYLIGDYGNGVIRRRGIKQAIQWAQNFTPYNTSDDVPFYHTIQVQAEHELQSGNIVARYLRAPTPNEIIAQGNLALCYGAKGIMYYCIMTNTPTTSNSNIVLAQYGLFDSNGNFYNESTGANRIQNPNSTQVPNERYFAVQDLNEKIDLISADLLQLTWIDGYSIHEGQPTGIYINNISSGDASASTFVELGLFKKTAQFTDANLEYFMIVNRRTLSTETRNISVTFSKSNTYSNWLVTEIGTANKWVVAYNGSFTANYTPGEGKLFRFEPLFEGTSETLGGNVAINTTLSVATGKTLAIQPGATLTFNNSTSLSISGILSATGASDNRILFTGVTKGSWPGINFTSSQSGSVLRYCNIRNADYAVNVNNSSPTIEYSFIDDADTYGIYITGSTSNPLISSNYIEADSVCIVHYYGSIGRITGNSLRNAVYGVYVSDGSPRYDYYSYGRNVFESSISRDKVRISSGQPWFGKYQYFYTPASTTYNYIRNNSSSAVDAQYNYWSTTSAPSAVYFTGSGTVNRDNIITSPPSSPAAGPGWTLTKSSTTDFFAGFENASMLFYDGKYSEARDLFRDLTDKNVDSAYASYSLNWYMLSSEQLDDSKTQLEYLNSIKQNKAAHELTKFYAVKWLMKLNLENGSSKNARNFTSAIVQGTKYDRELSLELAQGLYENFGDKEGAEEILAKLSERFTDKDTDEDINFIRKHMNSFSPSLLKNNGNNVESKTTEVPVSMNMFDAYPNPFNPTTTIAYSLTEAAKVNITIYDILGSEVTTIVDDVKEMGYYTTSFNASNLASGLYFARITINAQNQQPFIKTIKMMLTK